jgi:hypothetical protein
LGPNDSPIRHNVKKVEEGGARFSVGAGDEANQKESTGENARPRSDKEKSSSNKTHSYGRNMKYQIARTTALSPLPRRKSKTEEPLSPTKPEDLLPTIPNTHPKHLTSIPNKQPTLSSPKNIETLLPHSQNPLSNTNKTNKTNHIPPISPAAQTAHMDCSNTHIPPSLQANTFNNTLSTFKTFKTLNITHTQHTQHTTTLSTHPHSYNPRPTPTNQSNSNSNSHPTHKSQSLRRSSQNPQFNYRKSNTNIAFQPNQSNSASSGAGVGAASTTQKISSCNVILAKNANPRIQLSQDQIVISKSVDVALVNVNLNKQKLRKNRNKANSQMPSSGNWGGSKYKFVNATSKFGKCERKEECKEKEEEEGAVGAEGGGGPNSEPLSQTNSSACLKKPSQEVRCSKFRRSPDVMEENELIKKNSDEFSVNESGEERYEEKISFEDEEEEEKTIEEPKPRKVLLEKEVSPETLDSLLYPVLPALTQNCKRLSFKRRPAMLFKPLIIFNYEVTFSIFHYL